MLTDGDNNTTTVNRKIGLATVVVFEGTVGAINTFTKIWDTLNQRGFGLELPAIGESRPYGVDKLGVTINRIDEIHCKVF